MRTDLYIVAPLSFLLLCSGLLACSPQYVKGTEVEYSDEKQGVADVIERYRVAVERRDVDALRSLTSLDYYENGSTTDTPDDDYDYNGLEKVFAELKNTVRAVKYEITIKAIEVIENQARVDYAYRGQYLFAAGEEDRWATVSDENRLTLRRESGTWRILAGM